VSPVSAIRQSPAQWLDDVAARLRAHPWVSDARAGLAEADGAAGRGTGRLAAFVLPSAEGVRVLRTAGKVRLRSELQRWLRGGGCADAPELDLRLVESMAADGAAAVIDDSHRRWMPLVTDIVRDDRGLSCLLTVPYDLPVFQGHFPGRPIVPGVVQIGWAAALSRDHGLAEGPLSGIPAAKFSRIVRPGMQLVARVARAPSAYQVQFQYTCGDAAVATGRLQFGAAGD
jgi:3-hydroxymyristoyl/3-hydroxydecanoyl-(acyl carrier protein) dehydratase